MFQVVLKAGRERTVLRHHPWVFSGAVDAGRTSIGEKVVRGETVAVLDAHGILLGYGAYSPTSQIRIRMWTFGAQTQIPDEGFFEHRIREAVARRKRLLADPQAAAARLVNAESDGLPGLVVDYYAGWAVCQMTSAGAAYWKDAIVRALRETLPECRGVLARNDLKDRAKEGLPAEPVFEVLAGEEPPERIGIREGVCSFWVDVRRGHKTGFYLDQRDARQAVGALAQGADVLNCFSYTGGFGLYACAGGAKHVTQVDISKDALQLSRENEKLNAGATDTPITYVEADVFQYLRQCRDTGKTFDLIVLDPPKFAASKAQVEKAARGYKDINLLAMKLLRPCGYLATFSCSGAMTPDLFDRVLAEAAQDAGRDFQIVTRTRQGEDHPVALAFPEGFYLKGVILHALS